jgi:hypothetical protein
MADFSLVRNDCCSAELFEALWFDVRLANHFGLLKHVVRRANHRETADSESRKRMDVRQRTIAPCHGGREMPLMRAAMTQT